MTWLYRDRNQASSPPFNCRSNTADSKNTCMQHIHGAHRRRSTIHGSAHKYYDGSAFSWYIYTFVIILLLFYYYLFFYFFITIITFFFIAITFFFFIVVFVSLKIPIFVPKQPSFSFVRSPRVHPSFQSVFGSFGASIDHILASGMLWCDLMWFDVIWYHVMPCHVSCVLHTQHNLYY